MAFPGQAFVCKRQLPSSFCYEINPSYYDPISENLSGDALNGHFNLLQTSSPVSNPKTPSPNQKQQKYHHAKQNPKTSDTSYTSSSNHYIRKQKAIYVFWQST